MSSNTNNINKAESLFELAKKVREQASNENTQPVVDKIASKLEEVSRTGNLETKAPPIVVGTSGITISGNIITKESYLSSIAVDHDLYSDLVLTEEEARRINNKLNRFSSGVSSVIPMACTGNRCAFKATCLDGDTLIMMYDGTFKKIKDIKRRDRIVSFNVNTNRFEMDTAKRAAYPKKDKQRVYKLITEFGHELILTDDHPVWSSEEGIMPWGWASIQTGLAAGDTVIVHDQFQNDALDAEIEDVEQLGDGFIAIILSIEYLDERTVYDFEVVCNKNFVANGILTHNCPYFAEQKAPVGLPCLVEVNLLHFYTSQYIEEFDVDPSRITELHLISELAEFDIYEMRATKIIAEKYPTMLQEYCMGFDSEGNAIINEDISKVFELKDRLKKSRMRILETLMATRKERAKVIMAHTGSDSNDVSGLKSKLDMLLKQVKENGGNGNSKKSSNSDVIDAEYRVE